MSDTMHDTAPADETVVTTALDTYRKVFPKRLNPPCRVGSITDLMSDEESDEERAIRLETRKRRRKAINDRQYTGAYGFTKDDTLPYLTPDGYTLFRTHAVDRDGNPADSNNKLFIFQSTMLSRKWFMRRLAVTIMTHLRSQYGTKVTADAMLLPDYEYDFHDTGNGTRMQLSDDGSEIMFEPFRFGRVVALHKGKQPDADDCLLMPFSEKVDGFRESSTFSRYADEGTAITTIDGQHSSLWLSNDDAMLLRAQVPVSSFVKVHAKGLPADGTAVLEVLWDRRCNEPWGEALALEPGMLVTHVSVYDGNGAEIPYDEHHGVTKSLVAHVAIALCIEMGKSPLSPRGGQHRKGRRSLTGAVIPDFLKTHRCEASLGERSSVRLVDEANPHWEIWCCRALSQGKMASACRLPHLSRSADKGNEAVRLGSDVRFCPWCGTELSR